MAARRSLLPDLSNTRIYFSHPKMGVGLCIEVISMLKHLSSGFDILAQAHICGLWHQVSRGCVSVASVVAGDDYTEK